MSLRFAREIINWKIETYNQIGLYYREKVTDLDMATMPNKNIQECVLDDVKWGANAEMAKTSLQRKRERLEAEIAIAETLYAGPQTRGRLVQQLRQELRKLSRPSAGRIEDLLSEKLSIDVSRFEC
jgi:hypothetical protein